MDNVQWHFIPAHAPHFGGIWEATVKSFKHHLKRSLGNARLTFEEFSTVLSQIEACLNSRRLYPLTEDPQDDEVLTPSHLAFGFPRGVMSEPTDNLNQTPHHHRHKIMQQIRDPFWHQWSSEYLSQVQKRNKWTKETTNLTHNQVVLIKEDNLPPGKGLLGRIQRVYPEKDEQVRAVEVKCKDTSITRPIHKLCLLPIIENMEI